MTKWLKTALVATTSIAATLSTAGLENKAWGQESKVTIEEITVTARKRNESLLEVPLTVTAFTADDIGAKQIKELNDIVNYTPGFFYGTPTVGRNDRSNRRLLIRGMQVNTDVQTKQAVTVFIDGAPILGGDIGSTENAERIEVVKGPQSAYFGRATFAGAINLITKTPNKEFQGKVKVEAGRFGLTDVGLSMEGPVIQDRLLYRVSASRYDTGGQYTNSLGGKKLGARKTDDYSATLYATPTDNLSIKTRAHYWEDKDGPSASFSYGFGNGAEYFNCNRGGTAGRVNGNNNWICGEPPFPRPDQIGVDVVVTPEIRSILLGNAAVPPSTLQFLFNPQFLNGFGLERHALETSLVADYQFSGGITLSSITAYHFNKWAALSDIDGRPTAKLGPAFDTLLLNNSDYSDFSQEARVTSAPDDKLRWMVGGSYTDQDAANTSGFRLPPGTFRSTAVGSVNLVKTRGLFGSAAYDIFDQLTLNVEARRQWDKISDGVIAGLVLSDTFKSFTPRVVLDYKPTDEITIYASWAKGTRPGTFNTSLVGRPQSELDQIRAAISADISVPEERLDSYEVGFKGRLWDGRAFLTAAIYSAKWRDQQSVALTPITRANGTLDLVTATGSGGKTNLSGVEIEGEARLTDKLTVEGTFAYNDTDIITRDCGDCLLLLGVRDVLGLNKEMSRTPKYKGTVSASYTDELTADYNWFTRADYIYTGSMFETEANLTTTGAAKKVNLRLGIENDTLMVEVYGTNIFNDKTFTGYQRLTDFPFAANRSALAVGLPNRPVYGARATYKF